MRFRVTGIDVETGFETSFIVAVDSEVEAAEEGARRGVEVGAVERVEREDALRHVGFERLQQAVAASVELERPQPTSASPISSADSVVRAIQQLPHTFANSPKFWSKFRWEVAKGILYGWLLLCAFVMLTSCVVWVLVGLGVVTLSRLF